MSCDSFCFGVAAVASEEDIILISHLRVHPLDKRLLLSQQVHLYVSIIYKYQNIFVSSLFLLFFLMIFLWFKIFNWPLQVVVHKTQCPSSTHTRTHALRSHSVF